MNWRAVRASALMEWRRDWHLILKALITIAVCAVLAAIGPRVLMLIAVLVAGAIGLVATGIGAMTAARERMQGRVGWWRTIPSGPTDLMIGRIVAAGVLGLGFALGLLPLLTLGIRTGAAVPDLGVVAALFVVAGLVGMGVAAALTGLILKFRLERLFLILFALMMLDSLLLSDRVEALIESRLTVTGEWAIGMASSTGVWWLAILALSLALVGIIVGVISARWAVATATDKAVVLDTTGISRINWRRVRYPAGQPGPARATLMLQLRLAAERMPQQVAFIVAGVILLPLLPEQLATFASFYLPIMVAMIPTAVVGRTAAARMSGTIEGFATLPVRREWLVLGTLLAIAALALVAIVGVAALRYAAGKPMSVVAALALWGVTTGGTSLANGMAAWFTPRHLPIVLVLGLGLIGVVAAAMLPIVMAPMAGGMFDTPHLLQLMVGVIGLLLVAPLGGALYGRGLERFELVRK